MHYTCGYSGPGQAGGVCGSVAYVMSGGSLNYHCLLHYVQKFVHEYLKNYLISKNMFERINNFVSLRRSVSCSTIEINKDSPLVYGVTS